VLLQFPEQVGGRHLVHREVVTFDGRDLGRVDFEKLARLAAHVERVHD
jgi:hypothetical protein